MNLQDSFLSRRRYRLSRIRRFSSAALAGAVVALTASTQVAVAQVSVDGEEVGQTIQGYANRATYTSRARIATRRVSSIDRSPSSGQRVETGPQGAVYASFDPSSTPPYEFQRAQALRAAGYTQVNTNATTNANAQPASYHRPFIVDPWYQKRYEANHPYRYYRGLNRPRYHYGSGYGYTYYPYYRYRYNHPYSYYYRPYHYSYGWYYPSFSFYYGWGSYKDCRPNVKYRTNNWFDGYRYHRQVIYDGRSSRYGRGYCGSSGLSLRVRF